MGRPVALVVIDTLSRAMSGGDENGAKDMTAFVANLDAIRHAGPHVIGGSPYRQGRGEGRPWP